MKQAQEYDRKREKELEELGFAVIRFKNKMVFDFFRRYLRMLEISLKRKTNPSVSPASHLPFLKGRNSEKSYSF